MYMHMHTHTCTCVLHAHGRVVSCACAHAWHVCMRGGRIACAAGRTAHRIVHRPCDRRRTVGHACMYRYIYIHTCIYVASHTCMTMSYTYMTIYIHMCICMYMCVYTYVHVTYVWLYRIVRMCTCMARVYTWRPHRTCGRLDCTSCRASHV